MEMEQIPGGVRACCARLWEAGYPAYPVGGCVRDLLLGRVPSDYDVACAAPPEAVLALFPRTVPTGLKHGTVTVLTADGPVEVTAFRREGGYADGRRPGWVCFDADLGQDLARRDFTINAMALGMDADVIDPWGGMADLRAGRVRCVGDPARRFVEDGLRMLRAVRFSAQLDFVIEERTRAAIQAEASGAARLSGDRIRGEMEKILLSPRPRRAEDLIAWGLLTAFLPGREPPALSRLESCPAVPAARWAVFCWATGFPLADLPVEKRLLRAVEGALSTPRPDTSGDWRRALHRIGEEGALALAAVWGEEQALAAVLGDPWRRSDLAVNGRDLMAIGLRGPSVGQAQRKLMDHVLEHPGDNRRQRLLQILEG